MPNQRQKTDKRLVRKKRETRRLSTAKFIFTWLLLLCIALFFVQQRIDYTRTERRVKKLIIEKRELMSSILPLKLEERYLTRYTRIESAARSRFSLQQPKSSQTVTVKVKP